MALTSSQIRNLYATITDRQNKEGITLEEACELYARANDMVYEQVQAYYNNLSKEVDEAKQLLPTKLKEAITLSKDKEEELKAKTTKQSRKFDPWEKEIAAIVFKANPSLSKMAIGDYLSDVLPHRTNKSWLSMYAREEKRVSIKRQETKPQCPSPSLAEGDIVTCTVAKILPYGAMLVAENGVSGLLHKSEISSSYIDKVEDFVAEGQRLKAKVLFDHKHRLSFSIRSVDNSIQVSPPVSVTIGDVIPANISSELKKRYTMTDIKFVDLPQTLNKMIEDFEKDKEAAQNKIDTLKMVLETLQRESVVLNKLHELRKHLLEI
jgi:predicted RNA-binding protein with RPS1 domain